MSTQKTNSSKITQNITKNVKKSHLSQIICIIWIVFISLLFFGCAKKTETEQIIDAHIDHINQVVDYAVHNFDQNAEVLTLENELSNCGMVLEDVKASHKLEIGKCESETKYWKLLNAFLSVIIASFIVKKIKSKVL